MNYTSSNDYYQINLESEISNIDFDVMISLYQPIIGYKSLAVYLTLIKNGKILDQDDVYSHESLFNLMQISAGDFYIAKNILEAVGLIKTYYKEESGIRYFLYRIYSPKSPSDFFSNVLFKGLFIKYLGEKEAKKIIESYRKIDCSIDGFADVSSSFTDIFELNYQDKVFSTKIASDIVGHNNGYVKISFDYNAFFDSLKNVSQISKSAIQKSQLKEISRLSALYGLNESTMADIVADCFNPLNKEHIDFTKASELCRDENKFSFISKKANNNAVSDIKGDSILANKVKLMDSVSPADYLRIKQNNTRPANSDLKLIDDLSKNFGLNNGVINALIDFVLAKQDNKLSRAYTEKIAAQLARQGVETAIDTMNSLTKSSTRRSYTKMSKITKSYDPINNEHINNNKTNVNKNDSSDLKEQLQNALNVIKGGH